MEEKKMTIGIAGPMALSMLNFDWEGREKPPSDTYSPMISELINVLLRLGHKVVAYTTSSSIEKEMVYEGENLTICIAKKHKKASFSLLTFYYFERKALARFMKKYPVDIINAQWSYEYGWSALDSGIPTIITLHDIARIVYQYFRDRFRYGRWIINDIVLWKSKYLIANSDYTFDNLTKKQQKKSVVISNYYNPVLEKSFQTHLDKQPYIISVCTFDQRKNIPNGLQAFQILRKKFPHYQYYLLGTGMKTYGQPYAIAHGLADGVQFFENTPFEEIIPLIRNASVLLHPSLEESFGLAVLEAMIVGTPVVGGDKSGNIPYLLKHRERGMLCDVNNPQEMADCVMELLGNKSLSDQIISNAHQFGKENFSMNVIIPKLIKYYKEVLKIEKGI